MAEATVRVNLEGSWQPIAPVWSLGIEADEHGPTQATFVCKRKLPKFSDAEVLIDGLVVADGWIEQVESMDEGNLYTVTMWCWQRHLDDDPFVRTWMVSGFQRGVDARDGPTVDQAYWARAGPRLEERSLTIGLQPNTIWYANQAAGITFDLGPGGVGPKTVHLYQTANNFPAKTVIYFQTRAHSTRSNHHPLVTGQYAIAIDKAIGGDAGAKWHNGTFPDNSFRYMTVFLYTDTTYDMAKTETEFYIAFSDIRISTLGVGGGTPNSQNGSTITADMAVPSILAAAPRLTLGRNTVSETNIFGLATEGHQTPRQMLERINLDQWRWRVNPGRKLDREPYPSLPAFTIKGEASSRLRIPETYSRVIVGYRDEQGDEREHIASVASPRQRSQVIALEGTAAAAQAQRVADAFLADQAQRRVEGTVTIAPGQLVERPSGQSLHPSMLLLAGGDRAWLDGAGDHGRIVRVSYSHDTETAALDVSEPQDDLDRELAYLSERPA